MRHVCYDLALAHQECAPRVGPWGSTGDARAAYQDESREVRYGMAERTFVMVKPDGVGRRLIGEVMGRLERRGLKLVGLKMQLLTRAQAEEHYAEHAGKPFYGPLITFTLSGPVVQMVWEGEDAVAQVRKLNGATSGLEAAVGTIRGDYGLSTRYNLVHASDSVATAEREIALYFSSGEILDYAMPDDQWLAPGKDPFAG